MVNNVNVMYSDCTALGLHRSVNNFMYFLQEKLASHLAFVYVTSFSQKFYLFSAGKAS